MTSSPAIRAGACALAGAAAAAAILVPLGQAAGAKAPATRECPGRIAQILTEITVTKVTCAQGKALVRRWIRAADFGADGSRGEVFKPRVRVGRWRCVWREHPGNPNPSASSPAPGPPGAGSTCSPTPEGPTRRRG